MIAQEMGDSRQRGRVMWILSSSRPDLIEVDLKRPGRVDVKVPLLPTTTAAEAAALLAVLCRRLGVSLSLETLLGFSPNLPHLLTPGAAEALAVKIYRRVKTTDQSPTQALEACLLEYQPPVPLDILQYQMDLAIREATDLSFVPESLRPKGRS